MYETHFGLTKRPFRALAAGSDVFVGPQTAATIAGLKKALAAQDAIVAVSGPIGVGKTTLVRRALDAVGEKPTIVTVGRMQLGHDEVLELLLDELGAKMPAGTVQRFTTFRRLLKEHAEKGSRVIVVVEDASRIGVDALAELEALTAADAGVSEGANVVLMGDESLPELLQTPRLARLKQRLRLRQAIQPFSAGELTAYLKHCFRLAGTEYDTVFAAGTTDVLHALSDGVARMANNLVESALTAAGEAKEETIGTDLIKRVAKNEYGLDVSDIESAPDHHIRERRVEDRRSVDRRAHATQVEEPQPAEKVALPQAPAAATPASESIDAADDDEIPELIQDTLPDLAVLAPALAGEAAEPEPPTLDPAPVTESPRAPAEELPTPSTPTLTEAAEPPAPDLATVTESLQAPPEELPTLSSPPQSAAAEPPAPAAESPTPAPPAAAPVPPKPEPQPSVELDPEIEAALEAAQVGHAEEEIPAWERDPTLAELRPDLDALEHAMAVAQGLAPAAEDEEAPQPAAPAPAEPVPEITLDREIQAKIDEATEILKQAEEQELAEAAAADESETPVAEILAEANQKADQKTGAGSHSIESQLDATDAFAIKQIIPEEAELPVLETPAAPVAKAPPVPDVDADLPQLMSEPVVATPEPPVGEMPAEPAPQPPNEPDLPAVDIPAAPKKPAAAAAEPAQPVPEAAPAAKNKLKAELKAPDPELQKIAAGLSRAKTLDDVDDRMAETLFGEEFSLMAAEIAANGEAESSANDDFELSLEESQALDAAEIAGAGAIGANPEPDPQPAPKPQSARPAVPTPPPNLQGGSPDLASTQQRLATVRALNAGQQNVTPGPESIVLSDPSEAAPPGTVTDHPESIEEQINTSITQTLKALSVHPPAPADEDDDTEEEGKGGFFSRFRRS